MPIGGGDIVTADQYEADTEKVIARGRRVTSSAASTTSAVAILRLDDVPLRAGYYYEIRTNALGVRSTVANDAGRAFIVYTTDGSTPTTASPELPGSRVESTVAAANRSEHVTINAQYPAASVETLSILLCVARTAGTGNVTIVSDATNTIDLSIVSLGEDPGDSGVDL